MKTFPKINSSARECPDILPKGRQWYSLNSSYLECLGPELFQFCGFFLNLDFRIFVYSHWDTLGMGPKSKSLTFHMYFIKIFWRKFYTVFFNIPDCFWFPPLTWSRCGIFHLWGPTEAQYIQNLENFRLCIFRLEVPKL
jgi:hypothetical protein